MPPLVSLPHDNHADANGIARAQRDVIKLWAPEAARTETRTYEMNGERHGQHP